MSDRAQVVPGAAGPGSPGLTVRLPEVEEAPLAAISDPVPLFAERSRTFASAHNVIEARPIAGGVAATVSTTTCGPARLAVTATLSGALRLRWSCPAGAPGTVRPEDAMLGAGAEPSEAVAVVGGLLDGSGDHLQVEAPGWRFVLDRDVGWRLEREDGSTICRQRREDRSFVHRVSRSLATSGGEGLRTWSHESLLLDGSERLYGLGQVFGPLEKRGTRVVQWNRDAMGSNSSALTYHNTPLLVSSAGYGLVVHAGGRVLWEMGHPSFDTLTVGAAGEVLDLLVIPGRTPADVLAGFARLCGPAGDVPDTALGIWMSRCEYRSRAEVEDIVDRLEAMGFPFDLIHLDPAWMRLRRDADNHHGTDFTWDAERFGTLPELVALLRSHRLHLCLWENPYALRDSPALRALHSLGGIARDPRGGPAIPFEAPDGGECFVVDFTEPAAAAWWRERHHELIRAGVTAFKTDFAEGVRDDTLFADGRRGDELHNVYALRFNRTVAEAQAECGAQPLLFGRSGWLGSHRHPLQWSGDSQCNWSDLRGALRAGLSAAMSGTAWWSCDIGGFHGTQSPLPDPELYARWAWLGLLAPIARFHGTSPREPYHYGEAAAAAVLAAARLRYRLLPYLAAQRSGLGSCLPLLRPLPLAFPDDPGGWHDGTAYLLGDALFHAPLLEAGGRRRLHLPPGRWAGWWDGAVVEGPVDVEVSVPLGRTPLFQREGTEVPLGQGGRAREVLSSAPQVKRWSEPYPG